MVQHDIAIRQLLAADVVALSALAARTYANAFGHSMTAAELAAQIGETRSERYFHRAMDEDTILVAIRGQEIVGYVQLSSVQIPIADASLSDVELHAIYVAPELQGQGIGTVLMAAALAHPRLKAAHNVYLDVWDENHRALRLYERYGFRVVGRRDVVVASRVIGSDLVMMRRVPKAGGRIG